MFFNFEFFESFYMLLNEYQVSSGIQIHHQLNFETIYFKALFFSFMTSQYKCYLKAKEIN